MKLYQHSFIFVSYIFHYLNAPKTFVLLHHPTQRISNKESLYTIVMGMRLFAYSYLINNKQTTAIAWYCIVWILSSYSKKEMNSFCSIFIKWNPLGKQNELMHLNHNKDQITTKLVFRNFISILFWKSLYKWNNHNKISFFFAILYTYIIYISKVKTFQVDFKHEMLIA